MNPLILGISGVFASTRAQSSMRLASGVASCKPAIVVDRLQGPDRHGRWHQRAEGRLWARRYHRDRELFRVWHHSHKRPFLGDPAHLAAS
jgi:hypothetical protein